MGMVVVRKFGYVEAYLSFLTLESFLQARLVAVQFLVLPPWHFLSFQISCGSTNVEVARRWTAKPYHLLDWTMMTACIGGCELQLPCRRR